LLFTNEKAMVRLTKWVTSSVFRHQPTRIFTYVCDFKSACISFPYNTCRNRGMQY